EVALGLLEEASTRGWQLRCFLTDTGVRLLDNSRFLDFCRGEHWVALCELSVERYDIDTVKALDAAPSIIIGGQYQDAELVKNSDRVLVF
ncbi:hypothetical protein ACFL3P_05155, partial [Pseudomonadota bacterium]